MFLLLPDVLQTGLNDIKLLSYLHVSGIARTTVSFSGLILNNRESSRIYFSESASIVLIATFEEGNLFYDKSIYVSLK